MNLAAKRWLHSLTTTSKHGCMMKGRIASALGYPWCCYSALGKLGSSPRHVFYVCLSHRPREESDEEYAATERDSEEEDETTIAEQEHHEKATDFTSEISALQHEGLFF